MKRPGFVYVVLEGEERTIKSVYLDENFAEAEVLAKNSDWIWTEEWAVSDWEQKASAPPQYSDDTELFRPASLQSVVSQPSLTAAMTRAWLAWLAYNQPETVVSGDEMVDGKVVRKGETAAEAWSRLQSSESEREFLKLQQLVPAVPQR